MNDPLSVLREGLARVSYTHYKEELIERWTKVSRMNMENTLQKINREHVNEWEQTSDPNEYQRVLHEFIKSGRVLTNRDLKTLCYGVHLKDVESGKVLADDEKILKYLFELVKNKRTTPMGGRCFTGLFRSYLALPDEVARNSLRTLLFEEWLFWKNIPKSKQKKWIKDIQLHERILSDHPCRQYALELNEGKEANYADAIERLNIPRDSWFIEGTLFVRMQEAVKQTDVVFKSQLPTLLQLIEGKIGAQTSGIIQKKCVAVLVSRYADINDGHHGQFYKTPDEMLRDIAIKVIGNPIDEQVSWSIWVQKDKKPDERARKMIESWLKDQYINDFFSLLSSDVVNDKRRLMYWKKKVKYIENMWFLIGNHAELKSNPKYDTFFKRIEGRSHELSDKENSAFIMKMSGYFVIEFGKKPNAMYCYSEENLPEKIKEVIQCKKGCRRYTVGDIKNKDKRIVWLTHSGNWEPKFDRELRDVFQFTRRQQ